MNYVLLCTRLTYYYNRVRCMSRWFRKCSVHGAIPRAVRRVNNDAGLMHRAGLMGRSGLIFLCTGLCA